MSLPGVHVVCVSVWCVTVCVHAHMVCVSVSVCVVHVYSVCGACVYECECVCMHTSRVCVVFG